jgi:hypothetical protein
MRTYLALLAVVLGFAFIIARHDEYAALNGTQPSADQHNPAITGKADKNHPQENPKYSYWDSPGGHIFHAAFNWSEGTTIWAIILTLLAIADQTSQTRKAAEATQEAVRDGKKEYVLAEDTAKRQLRAYICMDTSEVEIIGWQPIANVHFKNCGQTPAYEVHGWIGVEVRAHPLQSPLPLPDDKLAKPKTTVGPGVGFGYPGKRKSQMFTPEELSNIRASPLTTLYVYGRVDYRDAFGSYWYTTVRLIAGGNAGLRVSTTPDGRTRWSLSPDIEGNAAT